MATYGYEAINRAGKTVKGSIEADSLDKVKSELRLQGLTIVSAKEQNLLTRDIEFQVGGNPTPRDLSIFCRQFVSMTRAGVGILEVLKMLCEQTENDKLRKAANEIRISVEKGENLSDSLAKQNKIFPGLMVNMVAAGEASGSLDVSMERMAKHFERSNKTRALVRKAMIYPIVLLVVSLGVVIVMLTFVIPNYAAMFKDMGTELPGITLGVMHTSDFIRAHWLILLVGLVGGIVFLGRFRKTEAGKRLFGGLALKIPITRNLVTKSASAQVGRTLGTLLAAGVPLVEAVGIVSDVMDNVYFRDALRDCREEVTVGMPLSKPLEECGLFPPMVHHMIRIGEEAGSTEEMLDKLAEYYEEEVEMAVQSLLAFMEPMIIIVLAGIVIVLIAACMAPMLKMYQELNNL